jgi:hypothetical protein
MSGELLTRRHTFAAMAASFSATVLGCRDKGGPKPEGDEDSLEEMPVAADPPPTLGWETIASGKYGPGVRSRHGLVYDRSEKAAVLFGGVVWTPEWNLQADTWELHGRKWSKIRFGDAWLFRDNTWKQMATNFDTDPRDDHGFGYHQNAKRMVMLERVASRLLHQGIIAWTASRSLA